MRTWRKKIGYLPKSAGKCSDRSRLVSFFNLIGWEGGRTFIDKSENEVKQNQCNVGLLLPFSWKLLEKRNGLTMGTNSLANTESFSNMCNPLTSTDSSLLLLEPTLIGTVTSEKQTKVTTLIKRNKHKFVISYKRSSLAMHVPLLLFFITLWIPSRSSTNVGLLQQMCNTFWLEVECWWSSCETLLLTTTVCPTGSPWTSPWASVMTTFLDPFTTLLFPFPMSLLLFSCLRKSSASWMRSTTPDCTAGIRRCSWNAVRKMENGV